MRTEPPKHCLDSYGGKNVRKSEFISLWSLCQQEAFKGAPD